MGKGGGVNLISIVEMLVMQQLPKYICINKYFAFILNLEIRCCVHHNAVLILPKLKATWQKLSLYNRTVLS